MNMNEKIASILVNLNRSLLRKFPAKGFHYSYDSDGDYHHGCIFLDVLPEVNFDDDSVQERYYNLLYPYFADFLCHITLVEAFEIDNYPWSEGAIKL